jgi:hypothetical protein
MKTPPPDIQESADEFFTELKAMRDAYQAMRQIHPDNREAALNWIARRLAGQEQARLTLAPPNFDNVKKAEPETVIGVSPAGSIEFSSSVQASDAATGPQETAVISGAPDFSGLTTLRQVVNLAVDRVMVNLLPGNPRRVELVAAFIRNLRDGEHGPKKGFLRVIPDDTLEERIASILEG